MLRRTIAVLVFGLLAVLASLPALAGEYVGESPRYTTGRLEDDAAAIQRAKEHAMKKAVQAGGLTEVSSRTDVRNFALVSDIVLTRVEGYLTAATWSGPFDHSQFPGKMLEMRLSATVRQGKVQEDVAVFERLLKQKGLPRFMVLANELVDGKPADLGVAAAVFQEYCTSRGLRVVDSATSRAVVEHDQALAFTDASAAAAVAKKFAADYLIVVEARADRRTSTSSGLALHDLRARVESKVVSADTAEFLAVVPAVPKALVVSDMGIDAAQDAALRDLAGESVRRAVLSAMQRWASGAANAMSVVVVRIEGISLAGLSDVAGWLRGAGRLDEGATVGMSQEGPIGTITVGTAFSSQVVYDLLRNERSLGLEGTGLTGNVVTMRGGATTGGAAGSGPVGVPGGGGPSSGGVPLGVVIAIVGGLVALLIVVLVVKRR